LKLFGKGRRSGYASGIHEVVRMFGFVLVQFGIVGPVFVATAGAGCELDGSIFGQVAAV
jgi:hypothetical protein